MTEHVKGKGKTELDEAGEAFSRMGVAEFRMQQGKSPMCCLQIIVPHPYKSKLGGELPPVTLQLCLEPDCTASYECFLL